MTVSDRRKHFMEAVGEHLPSSVYFHGTSPENAESIAGHGFSLANETHGRSAGEGVYLHRDPLIAAQHGQAVIAVKLAKGTRIAGKNDTADAEWRAIRDRKPGQSHDEAMYGHLRSWDYHGHTDVDDDSKIVHDPSRVQYVKHFDRPVGFDEKAYLRTSSDGE